MNSLRSMFPDADERALQSALDASGGDIEAAIDKLFDSPPPPKAAAREPLLEAFTVAAQRASMVLMGLSFAGYAFNSAALSGMVVQLKRLLGKVRTQKKGA